MSAETVAEYTLKYVNDTMIGMSARTLNKSKRGCTPGLSRGEVARCSTLLTHYLAFLGEGKEFLLPAR